MLNDLRYATRQLMKRPGFAAVALVTLALAIGANTAIFSVVHAVLLRPLPYPDPERLVSIWDTYPHWREREILRGFWDRIGLAFPEYVTLRERNTVYEEVAIFRSGQATLAGGTSPDVVPIGLATHTLLDVLGEPPSVGRWFDAAEDRPGAPPVAVLSHELWQGRFGGRLDLVGGTIRLDDESHTVIGVMPPGFRFAGGVQVWTSLGRHSHGFGEGNHSFAAIARLKPGVTVARARPETESLLRGDRSPETFGARVLLRIEEEVGDARGGLLLLFGASGIVLLLASVNLANLMLTRATERDREIALRLAIGAGRRRIVRQLLVESVVLATLGGALGALLAWWTTGALVALMPADVPRLEGVAVELPVLAFSLAASLATGLVVGMVPAARLTARDLYGRLREGGRAIAAGDRLQSALIAAQVGLALVLLVGAGLLTRTLIEMHAVDPGFRRDRLLTFRLELPEGRYPDPERVGAFYDELSARLAALPGVESVAGTSVLPLSGWSASNSVRIESAGTSEDVQGPEVQRRIVASAYFATMGIGLVQGRLLAQSDDAAAPPVMVISRAAADRLWEGRDPIGDRVQLEGRWWTVVGVVEDIRDRGLGAETQSTVYVPDSQWPGPTRVMVLRTAVPPLELASAARRTVWSLDDELPVTQMGSMDQLVRRATAAERYRAILISAFAVLCVLLAAIGIYGVTSYAVAARTRELGVRMALGAEARDVLRLVLGRVARTAGAGAVAGVMLAYLGARVLESFLFGVGARDPLTFTTTAALVLAAALTAGFVPARRAARTDPVEALRHE